jgi:hypothetical protein
VDPRPAVEEGELRLPCQRVLAFDQAADEIAKVYGMTKQAAQQRFRPKG